MSDLQVKIIPLVNAKVTKEIKVTFKLENDFFFSYCIHSKQHTLKRERLLIPCYYVKMESGGWKREKKIERARLTKKNAEHHADEMTHSDKRTKRGFRHSPEVTQGEPRSSLPARMNKRRSGFCWPGVYRGLSSLTQMSRALRRCQSSR